MLLLNCAVLPYILIQHEAPAAEAGKVGKAERAVKCGRLRRVVRRQLDLPHAVESLEHGAQQGCADPAALPLRRDQNILNEHDRRAVADCADQPGQLAVLPSGQNQQRMAEAALQRCRVVRVGRPADAGVEARTSSALYSLYSRMSISYFSNQIEKARR